MKTKIITFVLLILSILCVTKKAHADEKASGSSATFAQLVGAQRSDTRADALRIYLANQNSPLAEYADFFVAQADINAIPWDLLPAIAGTESTFGQQVPPDCNNAWGFGIYGDNRLCFGSYKEAIVTISKAIRTQYIDKYGARDVYDIGRFYAASPTWADHTTYFMHQIENFQLSIVVQDLPISL